VNEVADIPEDQIEPPPKSKRKGGSYIQGIGKIDKEVKILLDINKILYEEEFESITEVAEAN